MGRAYVWPFAWLTTAPSGRSHTHGADAGQTGWRLHLVAVGGMSTLADLERRPALCGRRPGLGWGLDMFIDQECERCRERAIALRVDEIKHEAPIQTFDYP